MVGEMEAKEKPKPTPDYLMQLMNDKKLMSSLPNFCGIFNHLERLLDEGERRGRGRGRAGGRRRGAGPGGRDSRRDATRTPRRDPAPPGGRWRAGRAPRGGARPAPPGA